NTKGGRSIAIEILLNQGLVKNLIHEGRIKELRECIEKGRDAGMQTFDQSFMQLYLSGMITEEMALAESDNPANLRLAFKQHEMGKHSTPARSPAAPAHNEAASKSSF